ncbi:methyltransferase [Brevibacterium sp.]|uniref:class I SAM-dependent methyltransferase n=1 Tax=Brevibacterium sp. TaxID=1701 RepID=UPI00281154CF|nr:methyltransferase [Brevibacterium sp.]
MSASLLPADSIAAHRSRELLAERLCSPEPAGTAPAAAGTAPARILAEYVLGRRSGELDVSGRASDGQFISAEVVADLPRDIVLIDDSQGLQARVLGALATVRTYNDRIDDARVVKAAAPDADAVADLGDLAADAEEDVAQTWAIVNAPKAVNALAEVVAHIQPHVSTLIVIGRSDAMSRAVNKELARGFARVDVSPGVGKHRMIIGSRPLSSPSLPSFPKHGVIDHPATGPLQVRAHGACFSGVKSDEGSAFLLDALTADSADRPSPPRSVLDLGCGNGWLLTATMHLTQAARGVGVDVSRAAVASARDTAEVNGVDVDIVLADAALDTALADTALADTAAAGAALAAVVPGGGSFDLVLLNPPFHQGTAIETDTAAALMRTAARRLAPGGRVLTVFNSHLRYRERLEKLIGPSLQIGRNRKFTVVESRLSEV